MDALHGRVPDHEDRVGLRDCRTREVVALFDVDRTACVLAFDIGIGVAHHHAVRASQRVERRLERARADRGPEPRPPQPQQQLVPALGDVERERAHLVDCGRARTVRFDQLLHTGDDVASVVEHRLLAVEAEVGEQHQAGIAYVVAEGLRQRDGCGRCPSSARAGDRDDEATPRRERRIGCGNRALLVAGDRTGVLGQRGEQRIAPEPGLEQGRGAEGEPVACHSEVVDDQNGRARASSCVDQIAIDLGEGRVGHESGERTSRRQPGSHLVG